MITTINHDIFTFSLVLFTVISSGLAIWAMRRGPIARWLFMLRMSVQTGICSRMMYISVVAFFALIAGVKYVISPGVCYITQDEDGDITYRQYNCTNSRFVDDNGKEYVLHPREVLYINQTGYDLSLATKTIDGTRFFVVDDVKPLPPYSTTTYSGFADYNFSSSPNRHHRDDEDKQQKETFIILDKTANMSSNHHIDVGRE